MVPQETLIRFPTSIWNFDSRYLAWFLTYVGDYKYVYFILFKGETHYCLIVRMNDVGLVINVNLIQRFYPISPVLIDLRKNGTPDSLIL